MSDGEIKLSLKEKAWLSFFLDVSNPETYLRGAECVRRAGYKCNTPRSVASKASLIKRKCMPSIDKWMDENGMSEAQLKIKLMQGLDAFETKFFAYQGEVVTKEEVIPWGVRHDFLKLAMTAKGMLTNKHELTGKNGGPIKTENEHFTKFPAGPMTIEQWERECEEADRVRALRDAEKANDSDPDGDSVGTTTRPAG
jgi:hypothetical protein